MSRLRACEGVYDGRMVTPAPADYVCPFCLIVAGREGPPSATRQADVGHRDELVTAFIASDWRPNNPGHVLVVPNAS